MKPVDPPTIVAALKLPVPFQDLIDLNVEVAGVYGPLTCREYRGYLLVATQPKPPHLPLTCDCDDCEMERVAWTPVVEEQ